VDITLQQLSVFPNEVQDNLFSYKCSASKKHKVVISAASTTAALPIPPTHPHHTLLHHSPTYRPLDLITTFLLHGLFYFLLHDLFKIFMVLLFFAKR